jgi:uncharacterized membrane protein YccC
MSTVASSANNRGGIADLVPSAVPALLFGLRLATAVSLALVVAFYLQLETPTWAGASACVVCQPIVGSSLLKGVFRMIGTTIGAFAALILTAMLPQDRSAFLFAMLLWASSCCFVSTLLRNFGAYAALLAGYTLIIVARTSIVAPDQIFDIAIGRATEICVGIVCGTLVVGLTDLGSSPRRLATLLSQLITETAGHLTRVLAEAGSPNTDTAEQRRALIARTAALDTVIGEAAGELPELLQRQSLLRAAMNGLFKALSGVRVVETHLRGVSPAEARRTARTILNRLRPDWAAARYEPTPVQTALSRAEDTTLVRRLLHLETGDPSVRLAADGAANAAAGLAVAANGLTLLNDPAKARDLRQPFSFFVADWLPALVNALRVFLGVGAAILFWITTAWPDGLLAVAFTAITIMAFVPMRGSNMTAPGFGFGAVIAAIIAAIIKFALLPNHETFLAFSLVTAIALVPLGALSTIPALAPYLLPATILFIPLLTPTNQTTYDTVSYFNSALGILTGCGFGIVTLMLFPPVSSPIQSQRLVDLSIRDLRHLAAGRRCWTPNQWQRRIYARLTSMPEDAEPIQRSQLVSTLSVGMQIIRLQSLSQHRRIEVELSGVQANLAAGNLPELHKALRKADREISSIPGAHPGAATRLRARSALLAIGESVSRHGEYFEGLPS